MHSDVNLEEHALGCEKVLILSWDRLALVGTLWLTELKVPGSKLYFCIICEHVSELNPLLFVDLQWSSPNRPIDRHCGNFWVVSGPRENRGGTRSWSPSGPRGTRAETTPRNPTSGGSTRAGLLHRHRVSVRRGARERGLQPAPPPRASFWCVK